MRMRAQSTGESGLERPLTREEFRDYLSNDWYSYVTKTICKHYKVGYPAKVFLGDASENSRHWSGSYSRKTRTIRCSHRWTGTYVHELAHFVADQLHLNGLHEHHNKAYWGVLQECIYLVYPEVERVEQPQAMTKEDRDFWSQV